MGIENNRDFLIARNPDGHSGLPYLVRLPLADGDIWLKTKDIWPHSTSLYCHPAGPVPSTLQIVERVEVAVCARRGTAIDLVLRRNQRKRCQFVFIAKQDRRWIFWKTSASARATRPGLRIPSVRLTEPPTIYVDTREKYPYQFSPSAVLERRRLQAGDYAAIDSDRLLAVIERKSLSDFVRSLCDASLMHVMAELSGYSLAAIAVEGSYSALARHGFTSEGFLPDLVARLEVRFPGVGVHFLENRKLAEDWAYRFLRSAYENAGAMRLPLGGSS